MPTELVQKILTSDYARQIYESISQIYGESPTSLWLMQAIGMQLDKFRTWTGEYIQQVTPETATWSLPYWEEEYGVVPHPNSTIEQRRKLIQSKMLYRAPMSPCKIEQIVSTATGADVTVEENVSKNKFAIAFGEEQGVHLGQIKKIINELKPAHLIYDFSFSLSINCVMSYQIFLTLRSDFYGRKQKFAEYYPSSMAIMADFFCNIKTDTSGGYRSAFGGGVDLDSKMALLSIFYPRYNVARLWLDGGWDLDGQYGLDGYLLGHYLDFYPSSLAMLLSLVASTKASNGLAVASGYPVYVEASSRTDFRCGALQNTAITNEITMAMGATVINEVGSSLVVEKDLWHLDGRDQLDGLWQGSSAYRYLDAERIVYENL